MRITTHFSLLEFACRDGTQYPIGQPDEEDPGRHSWMITRLVPLCLTLEQIRKAGGDRPIIIDSGYRTLAYDQRLYDADRGAGNVAKPQGSQHPQGRAADIRHETMDPIALRNLIAQLYEAGKLRYLGGLGLYPNFVHIDVRKRPGTLGGACDGHLAQWGGTRVSNIP